MAAELPQGKQELLPPASAAQQEGHLKVYHRCPKRHLRVLESKVARLVIELDDELKEKTASLGLSQALPSSSCTGLLAEIERTIAKRNVVYAAIEQEINEGDGNGDGAAPPPPPPPAAGM